MRIALIYPVAIYATFDVAAGYEEALRRLGHKVYPIRLQGMLPFYSRAFKAAQDEEPEFEYTKADVLVRMGCNIVYNLLELMPDLVIVVRGAAIHKEVWEVLRRLNIPIVLIMTESPYEDDAQRHMIPWADVCFTNDRLSAERLGVNYLPHAYAKGLHSPFDVPNEFRSDVILVGTAFTERVAFLSRVNWSGTDLAIIGPDWGGTPLAHCQREMFAKRSDVPYWYNGSRIGVNILRLERYYGVASNISGHSAYSLNARAFELAACGTFQLFVGERPEAREVFGDSLRSVSSSAEFEEAIRYWISNEDERVQVAQEQRECVKNCSYDDRAAYLLDVVENTLGGL